LKKILTNVFFLSLLFLASCASVSGCGNHSPYGVGETSNISRASFVKLIKSYTIKFCITEDECVTLKKMQSSGSGFVVRNGELGSYVMTAAHVCDDSYAIQLLRPGEKIDVKFMAIDITGRVYNLIVTAEDKGADMCLAFGAGLYKKALQISPFAPRPGERVYNLAAPLGIHNVDMIPLLTGFYNGIMSGNMALYTIPAAPGSSGSPVLNASGQIVGMIHSVHFRFDVLSVSPTYKQVRDFILENAKVTVIR
jgi:S1-C subfamily serine protease